MMKMRITKWSSNSAAILKAIPKEELSPYKNVNDTDITFGDPEIIIKARGKSSQAHKKRYLIHHP